MLKRALHADCSTYKARLSRGQVVACAASRYEYEVFSGSVTEATSEALVSSQSALLAAARAVGAWRKPAVAAVHQVVVRAPGGQSRAIRVGTASADQPAQVRCFGCPSLGFASLRVKSVLLAAAGMPGAWRRSAVTVMHHMVVRAPGCQSHLLLRHGLPRSVFCSGSQQVR